MFYHSFNKYVIMDLSLGLYHGDWPDQLGNRGGIMALLITTIQLQRHLTPTRTISIFSHTLKFGMDVDHTLWRPKMYIFL